MGQPELTESAAAWELRAAWAARWEVVLVVGRARRHRGYVEHVAPSSAFALLWDGRGLLHVPCSLVRAVRRPHFHETDWGQPVGPPPEREPLPLPMPGQLALDVGDGARPAGWEDPRQRLASARAEGKRRAVRREKDSASSG